MEPESPTRTPARGRRAGRAYLILAGVAAAVALGWLGHRWLTAGEQRTDDAQVEADVVPVAARIAGELAAVRVKDHQRVKAGEVLFELDPAELDAEQARLTAELDAARAQAAAAEAQVAVVQSSSAGGLTSARAALTGADASVRGASDATRAAEAQVARATADLTTAQTDLARAKTLLDSQAGTRRDVEHAQHTRDVAQAALDAATAQLAMARDQQRLAQSRVAEAQGRVTQSAPVDHVVAAAQAAAQLAAARARAAEASLAKARLSRSYAQVQAPVGGVLSRLGAHVGQHVALGQPLVMIVPEDSYVIANFKESQIGQMRPGDAVELELDAFPGVHLAGVVDTVAPATGARFSMIPPDNATGNFVKVVQRVPVKIVWARPPTVAVRPGLSAEVTVHVGR